MASSFQDHLSDSLQQSRTNLQIEPLNHQQSQKHLHKQSLDQSANQQTSLSKNQKWEKIIESTQNQHQSTPFILTPQSFKTQNPPDQLVKQRLMMEQAAKKGRQFLIDKNYFEASKQLSKTLMAFEFIAKNHAQTIPKEVLKQMLVQTVLPGYNNLALCYLKLKNYELVISFTNQVLAHDDSNVKARYRRALASKFLKNTEEAIKDFQIVKKLDPEMSNNCYERIEQCKLLQIQIKKKRKQTAKKFISGYQREDIKSEKNNSNLRTTNSNQKQSVQAEGWNVKIISWIKQKCYNLTKIISKIRPNNQKEKKEL